MKRTQPKFSQNEEVLLYESKHQDGDKIQPHHHHFHQVLYALEGEGSITLDDKEYTFAPDCAAVIAPYSEHAVISKSKLTLLVLAFSDQIIEALTPVAGAQHSPSFAARFQTSSFIELNAFSAADLRQFLRKLLYEQTSAMPYTAWAQRVYLLEVLLLLARTGHTSAVTDSNSLRAERMREYIDTHYYEPLRASDFAQKLSISTRHVNAIFKEQYDMTPTQYLTAVRIGLARKLLAETDHDIASICFEVGYESLATFYRTFKQWVNVSPNQFRQAAQRESQGEPLE